MPEMLWETLWSLHCPGAEMLRFKGSIILGIESTSVGQSDGEDEASWRKKNVTEGFLQWKDVSIYSHSGILQTLANFENYRMFVQSPLTLRIIAIFFFMCRRLTNASCCIFNGMFPLAWQHSAVSLRRQAHFHTDDNAPAPEPRASARNRSRNPNIVRMALTLSKDPAAGGAGEAGDCDRGTRKTLIASASGLNSQLTLWSSLAFLLPSPRMCWTLRNTLVRCLCVCLCAGHTRRSAAATQRPHLLAAHNLPRGSTRVGERLRKWTSACRPLRLHRRHRRCSLHRTSWTASVQLAERVRTTTWRLFKPRELFIN